MSSTRFITFTFEKEDSFFLVSSALLLQFTLNLIENTIDKDDKARLIFNWVQDNIKYVAFEDGMGGFIPRPAASVCHKRYGDCKDMASIITDMLRYAGIKGNITWVGSDELPYDYTEIADGHIFNDNY